LAPHEASLLNLVINKAHHQLGWASPWDRSTTVERTVGWYRQVQEGAGSALGWCQADLALYQNLPSP
jgi:CDP-glucose 4,6-dehydratase